jgi:hypothetical protein
MTGWSRYGGPMTEDGGLRLKAQSSKMKGEREKQKGMKDGFRFYVLGR